MDDLMSIGEFSDRSGLSPKRLRSYASAGLLVPAAVDPSSGYRYYSPSQLREAQLIDAFRRAGLPLGEIATLLRDPGDLRLDEWERQVDLDASGRHDALRAARDLLAHGPDAPAPPRKEEMQTFTATSRTDIGHVRDSNEDAVLCGNHLVAVADGMGGAPGGEVASALAISLVDAAFTGRSLDELQAAVRAANRAIADRAATSSQHEGMGTTLCAVGWIGTRQIAVVNVGDSRAYLLRDKTLLQLTDDHTVTAELVARGELSPQKARDHPHRHVLTRVLGAGPTVDADGAVHQLLAGDRLLLCTDGLFNDLPDDQIVAVMTATQDARACVDTLVDRVLSNGGADNISVVVADLRS